MSPNEDEPAIALSGKIQDEVRVRSPEMGKFV